MKAWTFPLLFSSLVSVAQPGDPTFLRYLDPCGIPPNDSIDVTNDGIPDLVIGGWSVGTDDVPSSSGNCYRVVSTLPGTALLCSTDRNGQLVAHAFALGDTVPSVDSLVKDDQRKPRAERKVHEPIADRARSGPYWTRKVQEPSRVLSTIGAAT